MLQQRSAHAHRIRARHVDLVDGDDQRNTRGLGVIDGFDRLRHHTVIGRDDQHHDVRHLGATLAHGGECLVTRRVDESYLLAVRRRHLIGADVLRDATRLARGDVGVADRVEQRSLPVVDVAHDRDDRGAGLLVAFFVGLTDEALFDVGLRYALGRVAELAHDEFRRVRVDHVVDLVHRALTHQELDDVNGSFGHAVGEFLYRDDFRNDHLAHDLVARLYDTSLPQLLAFTPSLERGKRTLALRLIEGVRDGELDALALFVADLDRTFRRLGTFFLGARVLLRLGLEV